MIETIKAGAGSMLAAQREAQQPGLILRKTIGFAIVTSGFAVIAAQALQHALGS